MNKVARRAGELFESGFFCAESILLAFAEHKNVKSELIPKIATGFCAGISLTSGLCGALTGGILALNMICGRNSPDESRDLNYELVSRFIHEFEKQFGSTNCSELLGCDLSTKEGMETFEKEDMEQQKCLGFTEGATLLLMKISNTEK